VSQENVELAYRAFDASARHDLDVFVAFHDPDCEIQPLLAAVGGNYHGHDGVREWWEDLRAGGRNALAFSSQRAAGPSPEAAKRRDDPPLPRDDARAAGLFMPFMTWSNQTVVVTSASGNAASTASSRSRV
jgi:SnoaL-like domain